MVIKDISSTPFTPAIRATPPSFELENVADSVLRTVINAPAKAPGGVSTDHTVELNNIDFKKMIGGPLQAAVDAQVASSLATVNFIQKVGFRDVPKKNQAGEIEYQKNVDGSVMKDEQGQPIPIISHREVVMVDFSHQRIDIEKDADGNAKEMPAKKVAITVPLLAMLPIPALRIEYVTIDFNVKLNSVESATVSDKLGVDASVSGGWGPVNFKVSASYQRQTTSGVEVKKEYALNVNVKAVQDEMPAGLEKVLGILAA